MSIAKLLLWPLTSGLFSLAWKALPASLGFPALAVQDPLRPIPPATGPAPQDCTLLGTGELRVCNNLPPLLNSNLSFL